MNNYGFIRTAAAVPAVKLADTRANTEEICRLIEEAEAKEVSLIVFPELSITGATCGDLFSMDKLLKSAEEGIRDITMFSMSKNICIVACAPVRYCGKNYDCAIVIQGGMVQGIVPKTFGRKGSVFHATPSEHDMPFMNSVFYAGRHVMMFSRQLFAIGDVTFSIEFGDDLLSPIPPSAGMALAGAQIIVCPDATPELLYRHQYRKDLLSQHSARTHTGYIYASAGFGESTTDHVYAGEASIWENGDCLAENSRFSCESSLIIADIDADRLNHLRSKDSIFCESRVEIDKFIIQSVSPNVQTDFERHLYRYVEPHPFAPARDLEYRCSEILPIQTMGLVGRLRHINCNSAVIGISGGLDSTLALLVTALAFDKLGWSRERIIGVTMPGYGTTARTKNNATDLMEALGITSREISIVAACNQHFQDIGHDKNVHDVTFENSQARERTQILMDVANQTGGLVIGTGDLSELALGWATYNGDHMSMYGVNGGIPKTLVRSLVQWVAAHKFEGETAADGRYVREILLDIADTPISPELLPANEQGEIQQVTEDLVGPYELHDFFIYNFLSNGYTPEKIFFLARKAFAPVISSEADCYCDQDERATYDEQTIKKWLKTFMRRFFNQQFKRSCLPDGPAVGSISLSPRGAWNMPSDAYSTLFQEDL